MEEECPVGKLFSGVAASTKRRAFKFILPEFLQWSRILQCLRYFVSPIFQKLLDVILCFLILGFSKDGRPCGCSNFEYSVLWFCWNAIPILKNPNLSSRVEWVDSVSRARIAMQYELATVERNTSVRLTQYPTEDESSRWFRSISSFCFCCWWPN